MPTAGLGDSDWGTAETTGTAVADLATPTAEPGGPIIFTVGLDIALRVMVLDTTGAQLATELWAGWVTRFIVGTELVELLSAFTAGLCVRSLVCAVEDSGLLWPTDGF